MTPSDKIYMLEKIFENQKSWISWANVSAMIGFGFEALLTGLVLIAGNAASLPPIARIFFIVFAVLSFAFYICSIFPKINRESRSFLYFGGIVNYSREDFGRLIKNLDHDEMEREYSDQIFILAKIAFSKFLYFRLGLFLSLASFAVFIFFSF